MTTTQRKQQHSPAAYRGKVALRLVTVEALHRPRLRVLDAFAGSGDLWRDVAKQTKTKLEVAGIERQRKMKRTNLRADNRRVLRDIDLDHFDVIDLDAWGVPAEQASIIAARNYTGPVIWTAIAVMFGAMPKLVLESEGIPSEWLRVCSSMFGEHDAESLARRWCDYLTRLGWSHHAWFTTADGDAKLYGVSTRTARLVTSSQFAHAYNEAYERDQDQMGQQHVEPDDGVQQDH